MKLKNKTIGILVENTYQDLEVWYPLLRLKEECVEVIIIGTGSAREYKGKYGYPITVQKTAEEISANDLDGIIIPGGYAPDILRRYPSVLNLVKQMDEQKKIIGAICHAGWVLISAGICKSRKLTGFFAIKDDLLNAGAQFIDAEVVVDHNLITSRKPEDLPAFMREIIRSLGDS